MSLYSESVGTVYGELTVLALAGTVMMARGLQYKVTVQCSCGVVKDVWFQDLRRGATVTCGDRTVHRRYKDRSIPAFNYIYEHSYRRRAIAKGFLFEITKEEFRAISKQTCHYCGVEPSSESYRATNGRGRMQSGQDYSVYVYNGLDRKDSSLGYTLGNVVPCCGICNHAKHTMSYETFIAWLYRLAAFQVTKAGVVTKT